MKTIDIKYDAVCREMELIENEAGIMMNNHRKAITRYIINHFTREHIPPLKSNDPPFTIPKELQDDSTIGSTIESTAAVVRSEGVDLLGPPLPETVIKGKEGI
jgi:hypothetical protein